MDQLIKKVLEFINKFLESTNYYSFIYHYNSPYAFLLGNNCL